MDICIYAETLGTFTSGMPQRGMMMELLKLRPNDHFIFIARKGSFGNPVLIDFFASISHHKNITLIEDKVSRKAENIMFLLGLNAFCPLPVKADVYIFFDMLCLGKKNTPIINLLADFSSVNNTGESTLNWVGRLIRKKHFASLIRYSTHIVAISNYTMQILHSKVPETQKRSSLVYNGIANEWFTIPAKAGSAKIKYFVWWGYVSYRKNLSNLLSAFKLLLKKYSENTPELYIVSNNPEDLQKLYHSDSWLNKKVKYLPNQSTDKLIEIIDGSCGVVFPSFYEGFGLPVIEAFARGKQVLTSNVTALPEVTMNKAIYCEPYNINSIFDGLEKLFITPDQNSSPEERGNIAKLYSYSNAAKGFNEIIENLSNEAV